MNVNAEILMNVTPTETRVAVVENGVLQEIFIERTNHRGLVGNIYKGKIVRVLPGMQAAFVDIGLERAAFIHVAEIGSGDSSTPINQLVHEGQSLVVQVTKDPINSVNTLIFFLLKSPSRPCPIASCSKIPGHPGPNTTICSPAGAGIACNIVPACEIAS